MLSQKVKKHIKQLNQKKFRKEFGEFIIEGVKGVDEALTSHAEVILLIVEGNRRDEKEIASIVKHAETQQIPIEFCGRKDVGDIKTTDTFPGVLAVVGQREYTMDDITDGPIVTLSELNDPGNLGTIIRTADWFGIKNILLSENCVDEYNPKVVRSTMGSIFHVRIVRTQNVFKTLTDLKNNFSYTVSALDMKGKNVSQIKPSNNSIYLFGSESHGVSQDLEDLIDNRYTIPGKGEAESLNVAVAAAILMSTL